jgi:hypothetical protein
MARNGDMWLAAVAGATAMFSYTLGVAAETGGANVREIVRGVVIGVAFAAR